MVEIKKICNMFPVVVNQREKIIFRCLTLGKRKQSK